MRFNNDRPIFLQIAEALTSDVLTGALNPGDRLPSARDLAASLEVNPNTAARALQTLADAGVARSERGTGYFVDEAGPDRARDELRRRFFETEVPALAKTLASLGLTTGDLVKKLEEGATR
jgi:GntR family transcriptional regulator